MEKIINYRYNFDEITTILDENNQIWFVASHVCKVLGLSNVSQALKDNCEPKGIRHTDTLTAGGMQKLLIINEPNLYRLIFKSKKENAKKFQDWIFDKVLPSIRKSGYYSIYDKKENITEHTKRPVQIENSKEVNKYYYHNGGVEQIIEHNRRNCVEHTGRSTKEIKQQGKDAGLKSNQRNSAKEVLRYLEPEKACSMSLADKLIYMGGDPEKVYEITRNAIKVFDGMIKLNIDVGLEDNKKDLLDEKGK